MRRHIALDYDGTIVSNAYPDHGTPEPYAAAVIKRLTERYDVTIFTARIAPFDLEGAPRTGVSVAKEVRAVDRKLKQMGLGYLPIWQLPWKPGADLIVDDRAERYEGDWLATEQHIYERLG